MPMKPYLTLAQADAIGLAARAEAEAHGFGVTIVVTDDAGNAIRLDRLDAASLVSLTVAEAKAKTAVNLRMPTSAIGTMAESMPNMIAIPGLMPFPGGLPLMQEGTLVGAIGVSGALGHEDEQVAQAGAGALRW